MENYTSDSSDSDSNGSKVLDFAYLLLDPETVEENLENLSADSRRTEDVESIILHHNQLTVLPKNIAKFSNVRVLDISNNGLTVLPDIFEGCRLTTLIVKNNSLKNDSLPKAFTVSPALRELNLSGNLFDQFPEQLFDFVSLKYLYLGGNKIRAISKNIWKLNSLQILSLGGNQLVEVPTTVGQLKQLQALVLCDNMIESLPSNIANLHNLKSLLLHRNKLRTLPPEIVALKNLTELSLRDNPLVVRFVSNIKHNTASLKELSARVIKLHEIAIERGEIPATLITYLASGHHCVNPNCKGVFFNNRVEHVKFVDFCGKYRIPLLQYLCSAKCVTEGDEDLRPLRPYLMKKVLLG
ncbi:leucine-rich repeat-containing protein 58 [Asbolus verrucosus]|uniref:Leucine-rich repeat-containing protein 58 n=1 Tax=Asbolus verrucosus TaxID=1661398 RepID=A0A482WC44_ASBVE|nr:leucine-rich repeat-containing protein 58 [Asbolus verrucosus]